MISDVRFLNGSIRDRFLNSKRLLLLGLIVIAFATGLFGMILNLFPNILMLHRCISIAVVFFLTIPIFAYHKFIKIGYSNSATQSGNTNLVK